MLNFSERAVKITPAQNATSVQTFRNSQFGEIRIIGTPEQPFFCLADVSNSLRLSNNRQVKSRLAERGVISNDTPTQNQWGAVVMQPMIFIDEPNLYRCIFQSRKPEAQAFQDWVTDEILPTLRKTGGYGSSTSQQYIIEELKRKVAFWQDRFFKAENSIISAHDFCLSVADSNLKLIDKNLKLKKQLKKGGSYEKSGNN